MSEVKPTLPPISTAARNSISSFVGSLDRPAPAARVAPMSDYARREGQPAPKPARIPLIARLMA